MAANQEATFCVTIVTTNIYFQGKKCSDHAGPTNKTKIKILTRLIPVASSLASDWLAVTVEAEQGEHGINDVN